MPLSVFPVMTKLGYGTGLGYKENLRVYDNLSYRAYRRSNAAHKRRELNFERISSTDFAAIEAFFAARKVAASADYPFYFYDPNTVNAIDLTGVSATGRHTAIFLDSEMNFTRDGRCRYSGSLAVLFLD